MALHAQQTFGSSTAKQDRQVHSAPCRHKLCMRSRAAPQQLQRLICNRGLIKHPRLGSGAHVRYPEARSSRSPKRPRPTKLEPAQAVADSMLSHDRGDESPHRSIVYPFCGFWFAHATSFLFHSSALSPCVPTPQPQSMPVPVRSAPNTRPTARAAVKETSSHIPIHASAARRKKAPM